jgi:hypothetical protein
MDIDSAFKSEVFRPLVTLVVPGSIVVGPYILVVGFYFPNVNVFWNEHSSAFVAIVAVCILAIGLVLENLGSMIECDVLDEIIDRKDKIHRDKWNDYLKLEVKDEIIGQRYLRTILTRMKFELAMIPALFFFWCGVLWMNRLYGTWRTSRFILMSAVVFVLIVVMFLEAYRSAKNTAKTRALIIDAAQARPLVKKKERDESHDA